MPHTATPGPVPHAATPDIAPLLALAEDARQAGRPLEAAAGLRALAALVPGDPGIRAALARALFQAGLWNEAWAAYEVRFDLLPSAFPRVTRLGPDGPMPLPPWRGQGSPAAVLVMGEQGLGDTIQFARYLPLLAARGLRVHAVLDARLHALLAPVTGGIDLRPSSAPGSVPGVRAWLPLMDLPRALGLAPQHYQGRIPYLAAERERVARLRGRIGTGGLRVGIVWQGNPAAPVDANRSVPLAAFAPLAAVPGVQLFALQKGPGEEQQAAFPLDRLGPELDGGGDWFLDTAAAIEALDLVVTVDTAVLHLAGALGRPALMLMHGRHADWRWLHAQDVPIWYPSVRLVRCPDASADWRGAVARAAFLVRTGNLPPAA
ncbi:glycosyltransferase family 9 protein [Roseomonas fluvialis]|uniref:glycosyltransferase family 9 protein n=1 Tax=Roseomonas fluvialis TaxID=1750527 RepID=UPI001FCBF876|nr:glycosyltransferase family 9 protein [Roseomonas fluvialis]